MLNRVLLTGLLIRIAQHILEEGVIEDNVGIDSDFSVAGRLLALIRMGGTKIKKKEYAISRLSEFLGVLNG
jgi:hypothetical protein